MYEGNIMLTEWHFLIAQWGRVFFVCFFITNLPGERQKCSTFVSAKPPDIFFNKTSRHFTCHVSCYNTVYFLWKNCNWLFYSPKNDLFNKMSAEFLAIFVATGSGEPKHDVILTLEWFCASTQPDNKHSIVTTHNVYYLLFPLHRLSISCTAWHFVLCYIIYILSKKQKKSILPPDLLNFIDVYVHICIFVSTYTIKKNILTIKGLSLKKTFRQ